MTKPLYKAILLCVAISTVAPRLQAQDVRFSQYYAGPARLNPAMIGVFNGTYRLAANYRDQYGSIFGAQQSYRTFAASGETRLLALKRDFVGLGIGAMADKAGSAGYRQTEAHLGGSYIKLLGKGRKAWHAYEQYLVAGAQVGFGQRGVDWNQMRFSNQFDGEGYNPGLNSFESGGASRMFLDANAGLLYYIVFNERKNFYGGLAMHHLNSPNISFWNNANDRLPMRWTLHGGGEMLLQRGKPSSIIPGVVVVGQGPSLEVNTGVTWRYANIRDEDFGFRLGLWNRLVRDWRSPLRGDALTGIVTLEYLNLMFGVSYDMSISAIRAANAGRGAIELSLVYVQNDNRKRRTGCPSW